MAETGHRAVRALVGGVREGVPEARVVGLRRDDVGEGVPAEQLVVLVQGDVAAVGDDAPLLPEDPDEGRVGSVRRGGEASLVTGPDLGRRAARAAGGVEDVVVVEDREEVEVRGVLQPALRYRLGAGEMKIELWYSENREWLALETEARGGRRLRYQLL